MAKLSLSHFTLVSNGKQILADANFKFAAGQSYQIKFDSWEGKRSLVRAFCGWPEVVSFQGKVIFGEKYSVLTKNAAQLAKLRIYLIDENLPTKIDVTFEQILNHCAYFEKTKKNALDYLQKLGLDKQILNNLCNEKIQKDDWIKLQLVFAAAMKARLILVDLPNLPDYLILVLSEFQQFCDTTIIFFTNQEIRNMYIADTLFVKNKQLIFLKK